GNAVGGALAGSMIGPATGKIAGAVIGSVIPGLGTIVGSLAGNFIGGTIGKLFGGGGPSPAEKAAEQLNALARAAQKVQEAIFGLPEGIKIASYRFDAQDAAPSNTKPGGGTGKTGGSTTGGDQTSDGKAGGSTSGTGTAPGSGSPLPGGKDGGSSKSYTFTGDIHLNGVTDLPSFFRQLSEYADSQVGRGGISGLQLSAG
ncbi:MAG TPA: hypothetical protein VFZ00_27260, partial [Solirubrobacter sp.]|nr:hypothetical protein [Solirubrobacter sp.]